MEKPKRNQTNPRVSRTAYNAIQQKNIETQDRLQQLLNGGNAGSWSGFKSEDEEEQAVEVSLLLRKNGKVPAVFYD